MFFICDSCAKESSEFKGIRVNNYCLLIKGKPLMGGIHWGFNGNEGR